MKTIKCVLMFGLVVWINSALAILTETVDGITWTYNISNQCAYLVELPDKDTAGSIKIPSELGGLNVVGIGNYALYNCTNITGITIPNTITTIGDKAFCRVGNAPYGGIGLKEIVIPESVTNIYDTSFLRSYDNSGRYSYRYGCIATNVFFLGDMPAISNSEMLSFAFWQEAKVYCVEGRKGWESKLAAGSWAGGTVKYGATTVSYNSDGVNASESYIFESRQSTVTIKCANQNATIYYTLDGTEPNINSQIYTGPIAAGKYIVKAIAVVPEYPYTVTETCLFAFGKTGMPVITATDDSVFYTSGNAITLTTETEAAEIRYTLDGSEPTQSSKLYTGPFTIDDTTTVKAKAFREDWFGSETATATFTREWYTVDTPVISPSDTTFDNTSQEVEIQCDTDGAKIYYTLDGSDPKFNGRVYDKPFAVYRSCTVRAVAVKYDWKDSVEASVTFTRGEPLSEAINLYGCTMETGNEVQWIVDADISHDGVSSARSGAIGNDGVTYLVASVKKAGTVSFWWRAQCEEVDEEEGDDGYYDYGAFLVDGIVKARIAGNDTGWQLVSVEVPTSGKHVLRWEYRKDGSTSYQPDCVWLDQVQWIPADGSGYTYTSPERVPYLWLSEYNLGIADGDFEAAANAPNGKTRKGSPLFVWEDYVAGTDPTNLESRLTAKIEMIDGMPRITWEPDLNDDGIERRVYRIYGSETLENGGDWHSPTNALDHFFKVTVELP